MKLVPAAELIRARDEKRAQAAAKAASKAAKLEAERQKRLQKLEKGRIPPQQLFKPPHVPEGTYTSWNEDGIPLTDSEGKELSKMILVSVAGEVSLLFMGQLGNGIILRTRGHYNVLCLTSISYSGSSFALRHKRA